MTRRHSENCYCHWFFVRFKIYGTKIFIYIHFTWFLSGELQARRYDRETLCVWFKFLSSGGRNIICCKSLASRISGILFVSSDQLIYSIGRSWRNNNIIGKRNNSSRTSLLQWIMRDHAFYHLWTEKNVEILVTWDRVPVQVIGMRQRGN